MEYSIRLIMIIMVILIIGLIAVMLMVGWGDSGGGAINGFFKSVGGIFGFK